MITGLVALFAIGPEVWGSMGSGRLYEAADGDSATAISAYEALLGDLTLDDPRRAELHYWLGRARFNEGDLVGARADLAAAAAPPLRHAGAREWLARMDLSTKAIGALPYREDFESGPGRFVRGWPLGEAEDLGRSRLPDGEAGSALLWHFEVTDGAEDFIALAFSPLPRGPTRIALRLRAGSFELRLRPVLEEANGRRWVGPLLGVPVDRWVDYELALTDFTAGGAPAERSAPPNAVRLLRLEDATNSLLPMRGDNELFVDDLVIR